MSVASRLSRTADDYQQRSAHHAELAERDGIEVSEVLDEKLMASIYGGVAVALREIVLAIRETGEEDLAA